MYRCLHTKGYPRAIEIGHGFSVVGTAVPQGGISKLCDLNKKKSRLGIGYKNVPNE